MRSWRGGLWLTLLSAAGVASAAQPLQFDTTHSRFGFEIRTRFGQKIEGEFPRFDGWITVLPDGRHQVRLRMFAEYVEIPGKPRYTGWMRGEEFFDVQRHPLVEFESDPYAPEIVGQGGDVRGRLTIRGVSRREVLHLQEPECASPGYDCDLVSRGTIQRGRYGMDSWQFALSDRVTFILRTRLTGAPLP
ncbi:YceI family protein [Stenotrophomonas mori]|uniref:YceI family protein n=1 Tax=Stenotrophomonas mori TaxID=2871096 RepID=A0ABT0SKA0_9GAMM|nr:YceI family protein [Stenotrophomonas mori]MCL7715765.1 YceI family protein [Stenotrophomonas mori]